MFSVVVLVLYWKSGFLIAPTPTARVLLTISEKNHKKWNSVFSLFSISWFIVLLSNLNFRNLKNYAHLPYNMLCAEESDEPIASWLPVTGWLLFLNWSYPINHSCKSDPYKYSLLASEILHWMICQTQITLYLFNTNL